MMTWLSFAALLLVFSLAYSKVIRRPLCHRIDRNLAEAQYEHARWIAICLEFTKAGRDAEAKLAAEQVVALRTEINFYRRALVRLRQGTSWAQEKKKPATS